MTKSKWFSTQNKKESATSTKEFITNYREIEKQIREYRVFSELDFINAIENKSNELSEVQEELEKLENIMKYLVDDYWLLQDIKKAEENRFSKDEFEFLVAKFAENTSIYSQKAMDSFESKFEALLSLERELEKTQANLVRDYNKLVELYKNPNTEVVLRKLRKEEKTYDR